MIVFGILTCAALLLVSMRLWRNAAVDAARQELFCIRNGLFVFWSETGLPFDHPAYTSLRGIINHSIRFAHVIIPSRHWLLYLCYCRLKKSDGFQLPDYDSRFLDAARVMDNKEITAALRDRHTTVTTILGKLFVFGSLSGWITFVALVAYVIGRSIIHGDHIRINDQTSAVGVRACSLALINEIIQTA